MKLYISRHGEAQPHAQTDALRPLTESGKQVLRSHWQSLGESGVAPSSLWVSPYLRAQQTATCIEEVCGSLPRNDADWLVPSSSPSNVFSQLQALPLEENSVLVSHMPLVAHLVAEWAGLPRRIGFVEGMLVCLEVDAMMAGGASLRWLHCPGEQRAYL